MKSNATITRRILVLGLCLTFVSGWAAAQELSSSGTGNTEKPWFSRDTLGNESRLSNADLRYYFEHLQEYRVAAKLLDRDRDGIVDGMTLPVEEFLARMSIILSDRVPFDYKCDIYGNPIPCERPDPVVERAM
jgi:hypothetical protein